MRACLQGQDQDQGPAQGPTQGLALLVEPGQELKSGLAPDLDRQGIRASGGAGEVQPQRGVQGELVGGRVEQPWQQVFEQGLGLRGMGTSRRVIRAR